MWLMQFRNKNWDEVTIWIIQLHIHSGLSSEGFIAGDFLLNLLGWLDSSYNYTTNLANNTNMTTSRFIIR